MRSPLLATLLLTACTAAFVTACPLPSEPLPPPPPPTTLNQRLLPPDPLPEPLDQNPALPEGLQEAEALGLAEITVAPGEPRLLRDELQPGWTAPASGRRSLWLFLHQSDAQLADAESPTRVVSLDAPAATESALRPQELFAIHTLDATIRTANALAELAPLDFALATGDNADSSQGNELDWFVAVWDGVPVRPDAGSVGAQPEPNGQDPLAEFTPTGAAFPWYAVAGNHDVLVQGNLDPAPYSEAVLGFEAPLGTRDLGLPGGPPTELTTPDPERALLDRAGYAARMRESGASPGPAGHGFTQENIDDRTIGWAATPVDGVPITLIAVDANPPGPGSPLLTIDERETWLLPQLARARAEGNLVVLTSHYALGGTAMEDGGTVSDLLRAWPEVVLVVCGHSHRNVVRAFGGPGVAGAFWQIETASTIDWPQQGRLVELVDNGDGTLSIFATLFDHESEEGSLSARGRALAAVDLASGWRLNDGSGTALDRNVELVLPLPAGWISAGGRDGVRSEALP